MILESDKTLSWSYFRTFLHSYQVYLIIVQCCWLVYQTQLKLIARFLQTQYIWGWSVITNWALLSVSSPAPHLFSPLLPSPPRSSCRTWWHPSLWATSWSRCPTGRRSWPQPTRSSPSGLKSSGHGHTLRASSLAQRTSVLNYPSTRSSLIPLMLTSRLALQLSRVYAGALCKHNAYLN